MQEGRPLTSHELEAITESANRFAAEMASASGLALDAWDVTGREIRVIAKGLQGMRRRIEGFRMWGP